MAGIWIRLMRKNRIWKDVIVGCGREEWTRALQQGLEKLDVARPLLIEKHERDWAGIRPDPFPEGTFHGGRGL